MQMIGRSTVQLHAAERQALEWLRDHDQRFARVERTTIVALIRRGLVLETFPPVGIGAPPVLHGLTSRGREALDPTDLP